MSPDEFKSSHITPNPDSGQQTQQSTQSKRKSVNFHDRFKGKVTKMSKEGHEGVVKTASKPIEPLKKLNPFSGSYIGPNMLA